MKKNLVSRFLLLCSLAASVSLVTNAQQPVPADTSLTITDAGEKKKENTSREKEKATYVLYAGVNFNTLSINEDQFESSTAAGYHLGFSYRSNGFFYWQLGLRFNAAGFELTPVTGFTDSMDNAFSVSAIDLPVTGGINLLSATNRVLNLRAFVSAVPSVAFGVGDNDVGIDVDNINSFNFYGQAGIGADILFVVVEVGYNYGFADLIKNGIQSKPGQLFINLGFRF